MKFKHLIIISLIFLSSCMGKGGVKVQNNIQQVTLQKVSWESFSIADTLNFGITSGEKQITDEKNYFPKIGSVEFYMVSSGKRLHLKTQQTYRLENNGALLIILSDTTKLINLQ